MLNLLYFYVSTFRSMCAVPNMAVFCSSLTLLLLLLLLLSHHHYHHSIGVTLVNALKTKSNPHFVSAFELYLTENIVYCYYNAQSVDTK